MIYITGDIHREQDIHKINPREFTVGDTLTENDYVIICGDFGCVWDGSTGDNFWLKWLDSLPWNTLFIDGNHENFDVLNTYPIEEYKGGKVHRIRSKVFHLMRGEVFDIDGYKFFTMGGGKVAARKISRLKGFGVKIKVVAPSIVSDIEAVAQACDNISVERRIFTPQDIENVDFVIAAAGEEVDKEATRLCKEKAIPVNVVDNQELCDFIFPSIVQKGDMVAGFVTGGKSPHVAAKLRRDFEANVSDNIESILDYLSEVRTLAKEKIDDDRKRAAFIREVSEFCMKADRVCSNKEENAFLQKYLDNRSETVLPGAALVGAGCGSYELITIKGLNEIRRAEVIVYDDLIDEHLLEFAPESCELIYAGKRSGRHSKAQEEINELLVEKALEGRYVVRLKGGDPYVFGRGGEEALALKEHGIPVHEVPGVTSGIGLSLSMLTSIPALLFSAS